MLPNNLENINQLKGLSHKHVSTMQKSHGFNELETDKKHSYIRILLDVVKDPMLSLLLISGGIYLTLGETKDAILLLFFVLVIIGITFFQESKTQYALDALKKLSSPRALVVREGKSFRIPGREVVVGDYLIVGEGDRIPADATILDAINLMTDESMLTGESVSVIKSATKDNLVYAGTLVTQGRALLETTKIGAQTEIGKIGKSLQTITEEETQIKKETRKLVLKFATIGIILCIAVIFAYGVLRQDWMGGFLAGLSLGMSLLPEEFSVILVIFLALGAWRISKNHVLSRNNGAIETLGAINTLCVDKTGTITQNKMELELVLSKNGYHNIKYQEMSDENLHEILEYARLASQRNPQDPIENEINDVMQKYLKGTEHLHDDWKEVKEYPLTKDLFAVTNVWESSSSGKFLIAAKGSPEAILDLCKIPGEAKDKLEAEIDNLSQKGLRILGVAKAVADKGNLPTKQEDFKFTFLGLLGFADPVKPNVHASIKECYQAGIRVCVITGDYPGTALNVAAQIGLKNAEHCLTGSDIKKLNDSELQEKIKSTNVFARIIPEQKLRIVNALKANGSIVAMTGDGVNDAPALKSANVGISMGNRGTDVAREASDLVLLDDNFSSIVDAIKMGRRIYDNLKNAISYTISVHMPIAGMALVPILVGKDPILLPAHIALLELIIGPACSTVFESSKEDANIMKRDPRKPEESILNNKLLGRGAFLGFFTILWLTGIYFYFSSLGMSTDALRTICFVFLVLSNIFLIVSNITWGSKLHHILFSENKPLVTVGILASLVLGAIVMVPTLRFFFRLDAITFTNFLIVLLVAIANLLAIEALKKFISRV